MGVVCVVALVVEEFGAVRIVETWGDQPDSCVNLKVELDGSRIILRKNVDDAISRARGRFKLPAGTSTDDVMRELRGRAPGDPIAE